MKPLLPPHIGWPLMIVALLGLGVASAVATLFAARSDGGAQVIENYYEKAAHWDDQAAAQAASDALGWEADVRVLAPETQPRLRPVQVTIRAADGAPVAGLTGTIRAARPHLAVAVAEIPLVPVADAPGVYRQQLPIAQAGLWDFHITAARGSDRFLATVRRDISP
jgi:nitrogen fixation protein FixH